MNLLRLAATAALVILLESFVTATPAEIIFLRHAEKPISGSELNAQGWKRAQALAWLFTQDVRVQEHGRPAALFAAGLVKRGGSVRSIQTLTPAGRALNLAVDSHINRDDIAGLVRAVLESPATEGKTVVICWEHKKIPEMLPAFGWTRAPKAWPDNVFDRLWVLDFEGGRPARFRDLPQKLLPGDAAE